MGRGERQPVSHTSAALGAALGPLSCLAAPAYNEGIINFGFREWKTRMWTLYGYTICADDIYWFISSPHLSLTFWSDLGHNLFPGILSQSNFLASSFLVVCFESCPALLRETGGNLPTSVCQPPGKSLWPSRTMAGPHQRGLGKQSLLRSALRQRGMGVDISSDPSRSPEPYALQRGQRYPSTLEISAFIFRRKIRTAN